MKIKTRLAIMVLIFLISDQNLQAHHSMSIYNQNETVTVTGEVRRVQWVNPHVYIFIDEKSATGEVSSWVVEGLNPASMRRAGWTRDTLKLGDLLTVSGYAAKDHATKYVYPASIARNSNLLFDESAFYKAEQQGEHLPYRKTNQSIEGIWKGTLIELQEFFGRPIPTPKGRLELGKYEEQQMNPALSCKKIPAPMIMLFGDVKQIELSEDYIVISGDYDGGERIINMNIANHNGVEPSLQGHSIGRWEGNTLVIDTRLFDEHIFGNGIGLPSGEYKHLIERLTVSSDNNRLECEFQLFDSEFLESSVELSAVWDYRPNLEFVVEECDLESARRFQVETN